MPDKPKVKWNRGTSTIDGLGAILTDAELATSLTSRAPKYDPFGGSSREYVWTDGANCSGADPELFQVASQGDPIAGGRRNQALAKFNRERAELALAFCEGCPVKRTCLREATEADRYWSVRGGELPVRLTGSRAQQAYVPTSENSEYEEPWSCKLHGVAFRKSHLRRARGKEYTRVYCTECGS